MDVVKSFRQAIDIVQLKEKAILAVVKENDSVLIAFIITIIGGILMALNPLSAMGILTSVMYSVLALVALAAIFWGLSTAFKGKAKYMDFLKPMGYVEILSWLGVFMLIPKLGIVIAVIAALWSIVVYIYIAKFVAKLEMAKAVWVVLIPVIIMAIIAVLGVLAYTAQHTKGLF